MNKASCKKCGFLYTDDDGIELCYILKQVISTNKSTECKSFIEKQYDGNEPFSPMQHEWLLRDELEKKKMKKMQGLRF